MYAKQTGCRRCGTCCIKGGPALHVSDMHLIKDGLICLSDIFTIRAGEPAYDNVLAEPVTAPQDIIRIKGKKGYKVCTFFDEDARSCRIYKKRPEECRLLACWEPDLLAGSYKKNRLARSDILKDHPLFELVDEHQRRCDLTRLFDLIETLGQEGDGEAQEEISMMLSYDIFLRDATVARGLDRGLLHFLFGIPLVNILSSAGFTVTADGRGFILKR